MMKNALPPIWDSPSKMETVLNAAFKKASHFVLNLYINAINVKFKVSLLINMIWFFLSPKFHSVLDVVCGVFKCIPVGLIEVTSPCFLRSTKL